MCLSGMIKHAMNKEKRKNIIEAHPYKIWLASDNNWKTYVYDETKKNHRRLIKKSKKEDLEKVIIEEFIKKEAEQQKKKFATFRSFFPEWIKYKSYHTRQTSYIARIINDWNRFYINSSIVDVPLQDLTSIAIDVWLHDTIKQENLTKKSFYNMSLILRQGLEYCEALHLIPNNPMNDVKIQKNLFRKKAKPESRTQVFTTREEVKMKRVALQEFHETEHVANLAILLNFQLGLRIGELVALKQSDFDIKNKVLHVNYMEIKEYTFRTTKDNIVEKHFAGLRIVPYTKTDAGLRTVILTDEAINIYKNLISLNSKRDFYNKDFLFLDNTGNRITANMVDYWIVKCCHIIGIPDKRIHKVRKTYISTLLDEHVNMELVRRMVGHTDEQTTFKNYCFDRREDDENIKLINKALNPISNEL